MKRILSLALLLAGVVSTQPALAGNYSPAPHMREPVTPPPSPWEGWFAGLHAGYGIGDVTIGGRPGRFSLSAPIPKVRCSAGNLDTISKTGRRFMVSSPISA